MLFFRQRRDQLAPPIVRGARGVRTPDERPLLYRPVGDGSKAGGSAASRQQVRPSSGTVPLTSGLIAHVFDVRYLSTLSGIAFLVHQIGSSTGVW